MNPMAEVAEPLVWDASVLGALFGNDAAVIAALERTFEDSVRAALAEAEAAAQAQQADALRAIAHRIKGAARMSGALALGQAAEVLERQPVSAGPVELIQALAAVQTEWLRVLRRARD